ncbi:MAG: thiamine pyrophosphate-binding protein [Candidatus Poribacteria bacterium]|nr:thiamine pyrophosphate-binding protein [Candidatus Poribacteria bacterium]
MTDNELVVELLERHDIHFVFGAPDNQNMSISHALSRSPKIRYLQAKSGQAAGLMADGYARATGKVGVSIATTGQAAAGMVTAIATAFTDNVPLLFITIQAPSSEPTTNSNHREWQAYCEDVDKLSLFKPITTWNTRIKNSDEISKTVARAFGMMAKGRPGPVHLEIPADILESDFDAAFPRSFLHACDLQTAGYALPAGLGAKAAYPGRPVVAVTDTVGLLISGQELLTAADKGLNILTIVVRDQPSSEKPDFVQFAESLGISGFRVDGLDELETVLKSAQAQNRPTVIEVRLS